MIKDGDSVYADRVANARHVRIPADRAAEWAVALYWQGDGPPPDTANMRPAGPGFEIEMYLNHGRWIVECPACHGAQLAVFNDPRFICNVCGNAAVGRRWRRVIKPSPALRQGIENAVRARPEDAQNWTPGQTVDDLLAENVTEIVAVLSAEMHGRLALRAVADPSLTALP